MTFTFLIPAVILNSAAEIVIPIAIPTKEVKAEIETHRVTTDTKISKCSILFKTNNFFFALFTH